MIFAIDFGTSNSLISLYNEGRTCEPAAIDGEANVLKSVIYFPDKSQSFFGQEAIAKYTENDFQGRLFRSIKKFLPDEGFRGTDIEGQVYTLEQIIGSFLRTMKLRAEAHYQLAADSVVLGRPAKFSKDPVADEIAETRLLQAAVLAGFKDISFFPEPLAAAFSYRQKLQEAKTVLIVDLGGGTSDFTLIRLQPQGFRTEDVLSMHGIPLAGDAIDGAYMRSEIAPFFGSQIQYQLPMSKNKISMPASLKYRISSPAELALLTHSETTFFLKDLAKTNLSQDDKTRLDRLFALVEDNLGYQIFSEIEKFKIKLCQDKNGLFSFPYPEIEIEFSSDYDSFLSATETELDAIKSAIDETLQQAQVTSTDVDLVVCTGGTSQIPEIQDHLKKRFSPEKIDSHQHFHSIIGGLTEQAKFLFEDQSR